MFAVFPDRTTRRRPLIGLLVLASLFATGVGGRSTSAQPSPPLGDDTTQRYGWVNAGIGGGSTGPGLSIAGGVPIGDRFFVGGRHVYTTEFDLLDSGPSATTWDAGPVAGVVLGEGRYGHVSLGGGVAVVGGRRPDEPGTKSLGLGIPLDVQAFVTPVRYVGVGVQGYANLSPGDNLLGVSLQLQVRFPR